MNLAWIGYLMLALLALGFAASVVWLDGWRTLFIIVSGVLGAFTWIYVAIWLIQGRLA